MGIPSYTRDLADLATILTTLDLADVARIACPAWLLGLLQYLGTNFPPRWHALAA